MTTATTTAPVKGDTVTLISNGTYPATNGYGRYALGKDTRFVITREYTNTFTIRREKTRSYEVNSYNVPKNRVVKAAPPVDLAAVPAGKISPSDPNIQWLWERAGQVAKELNYCSEYDKLADKLGIPGRERTFTVTVNHNGLSVSTKIKARSRTEAEQKVKETLKK